MAKGLSAWERSARTAERERERQSAAALRARERAHARDERAQERAQLRHEKAIEREERREAREREIERSNAEKQAQIETWRAQVEAFNAYLNGLESLHRVQVDLARWRSEYATRCEELSYRATEFAPERFQAGSFSERPYPGAPYERSTFKAGALWRVVLASVLAISLEGVALWQLGGASRGATVGIMVTWLAVVVFTMRQARATFDASDAERRKAHQAQEVRRWELFVAREADHHRAFDEGERARADAFAAKESRNRAAFESNEADRLELLLAAKEGATGALTVLVEAALPVSVDLTAPDGLASASLGEHEVAYRVVDGTTLHILIQLPEEGVVPDRRIEMTPSNDKLRFKEFPARPRAELFTRFAASLTVRYVLEALRVFPLFERVLVETYLEAVDPATGKLRQNVIVQANVATARFADVDIEAVDPVEVFRTLDGVVRPLGKKGAEIPHVVDRTAVMWATVGDDGFEIPHGVLPGSPPFATENEHARLPHAERQRQLGGLAGRRASEEYADLASMTIDRREAEPSGGRLVAVAGLALLLAGMSAASFAGVADPKPPQPDAVASAALKSEPQPTGPPPTFCERVADDWNVATQFDVALKLITAFEDLVKSLDPALKEKSTALADEWEALGRAWSVSREVLRSDASSSAEKKLRDEIGRDFDQLVPLATAQAARMRTQHWETQANQAVLKGADVAAGHKKIRALSVLLRKSAAARVQRCGAMDPAAGPPAR